MDDKPHGEDHEGISWCEYRDEKLPAIMHVIPMNDTKRHNLDAYKCECKPVDSTNCVLHSSFDGRERYQFGWRLVN